MGQYKHIVQEDGITYYMTDTEFAHKDEWIQLIKDHINECNIKWDRKKEEFYKKYETP